MTTSLSNARSLSLPAGKGSEVACTGGMGGLAGCLGSQLLIHSTVYLSQSTWESALEQETGCSTLLTPICVKGILLK